jgi:hypothetical protein
MTLAPETPRKFVCLECAANKHDNCDGMTLDDVRDVFIPCECVDHAHLAALRKKLYS